MIDRPLEGVSFIVPVHNGAAWIRGTIASILAQADGRPMEVIVVDDRSRDGSTALLLELAAESPSIRVIAGAGLGAAAAINIGIRAAHHPIICQVDQDVVLGAGWMQRLVAALNDPSIAAAQGYYATDREDGVFARAMSLDLEQRYAAIDTDTTHACTGNSAYRAEALHRVGLFDESFGYGYDNDLSYRLQEAGYRLTLCRSARSFHRWRDTLPGYLAQQYGFGYGRIDLVAKHPGRVSGDSVAPSSMMLHPLIMTAALAAFVLALPMFGLGGPWRICVGVAAALIAGLALERTAAGLAAARRFRDPAALIFPVLHFGRDVAWVCAIAAWTVRRLAGTPRVPSHSMRPRDAASQRIVPLDAAGRLAAARLRTLCLLPAHNEGANLTGVIAELRVCRADLDVLVVDDGSTDETPDVLESLEVKWLRLPERLGIGSAMRAGLRYARHLGYDVVVRMDGDGQHRPDDIERLLSALELQRADVALGSQYAEDTRSARVVQRTLAACLGALTGKRVTDPTSGFYGLGPRAVRLLAEHHPTGYPEPELRLFLSRNALKTVEVPVRGRPRPGGRTSLTAPRLAAAGARVVLAMIIVPLRHRVGRSRD